MGPRKGGYQNLENSDHNWTGHSTMSVNPHSSEEKVEKQVCCFQQREKNTERNLFQRIFIHTLKVQI